MRHTKAKLNKLKQRLDLAKKEERNIQDRYSTNYKNWQVACNKVTRLKNQYNKLVAEHNYDNGLRGGFSINGSIINGLY